MLQEASAKRIFQVATAFDCPIHQVCEREELRFRASAERGCHERVEAEQHGMERGRIIMKGLVARAALRENLEQLLQELLGTLRNLSHFRHNIQLTHSRRRKASAANRTPQFPATLATSRAGGCRVKRLVRNQLSASNPSYWEAKVIVNLLVHRGQS